MQCIICVHFIQMLSPFLLLFYVSGSPLVLDINQDASTPFRLMSMHISSSVDQFLSTCPNRQIDFNVSMLTVSFTRHFRLYRRDKRVEFPVTIAAEQCITMKIYIFQLCNVYNLKI